MLVAVSGSQGSGKTTVLNELVKLGYHVIERKTSRSIQKDWGYTLEEINSNKNLTMKFQQEILKRKWDDEYVYVNKEPLAFTERTYADLFTYALLVLGKEPSCSDFLDDYFEQCKIAQAGYTKVFMLTAGLFPVEWDVNRASANSHYCKLVDRTLMELTEEMAPTSFDPTIEIIKTGDLEKRVQQIVDALPSQ